MTDAGKRLIESLKQAVAGNFARVTVDGQVWVRQGDGDVRCDLDSRMYRRLRRLADKYWDGDIDLCTSDLLRTQIVAHSTRPARPKSRKS